MFVCIAGKNDIAVNLLQYLTENHPELELGVVCNKTDLGVNGWQGSLRWYAGRWQVPEYTLEHVYGRGDMVLLSLEFDRLLRPERFASRRLFNIHFSLLPTYKGMYTSALPILNGEREVGVTLHRIDAGIDTGEIIAQRSFPVGEKTSRELYLGYIRAGTELVLAHIEDILAGRERSYPQPGSGSTYYSRASIDYGHIEIDLNQTAEGVARQIRAFAFREYQLPTVYGRPIVSAHVTAVRSWAKPGTILTEDDSGMLLASVDYNVALYFDRLAELLDACRKGDLPAVKAICAAPGLINAQDEHGWSPLIVAAYNGRTEVVRWLLLAGADIHAVSHNGTNLLMYAKDAALRDGNNEMFLLFRSLGLRETQQDRAGHDLLYYLEKDGHRIEDIIALPEKHAGGVIPYSLRVIKTTVYLLLRESAACRRCA